MTARRYQPTRGDVLRAVGPVPPHPDTAPDDPDPFGHNERPWTVFLIACRITRHHALSHPVNRPGEALRMDRLRELLIGMAADGSIVGRTRREWAAMRREPPSRASDVLYASVEHAAAWDEQWARDNDNEGES